jgi:hypothetical protein
MKKKLKKATEVVVTASLASALTIGAMSVGEGDEIPGVITLQDYSRAFFDTTTGWREIVIIDAHTAVEDTLEGSFAKEYYNEVYDVKMRMAQWPKDKMVLWPRPTMLLEVIYGAGRDQWFSIDPIWRPSPNAQISFNMIRIHAPNDSLAIDRGDTVTSGSAVASIDSFFAVWPIEE